MAAALAAQRHEQVAFLGGVAHDLRNPLSALAMSVGTLAPEGPMPPEKSIRRTVATIRRQVTHLERMIGDILELTKIEAGHVELQPDVRQLEPLVREVVSLFEVTSGGQRIKASIPDEPVRVRCDAMRIEQVVSNLVSNAIKYSPSGRDVEVSIAREGSHAVIAVSDHGVGIGPLDQARLFEPFRRVGLSKETIPGVGLGLFVVKRIVEAHGGRIYVESSLGRGSTFRVFLPLADVPA